MIFHFDINMTLSTSNFFPKMPKENLKKQNVVYWSGDEILQMILIFSNRKHGLKQELDQWISPVINAEICFPLAFYVLLTLVGQVYTSIYSTLIKSIFR